MTLEDAIEQAFNPWFSPDAQHKALRLIATGRTDPEAPAAMQRGAVEELRRRIPDTSDTPPKV